MREIRHKRAVAAGILVLAMIGSALLWLSNRGLSLAERRLFGQWTYQTVDSAHQQESATFFEDGIARVDRPKGTATYYEWYVDGGMLVLTPYEYRDLNETTHRRVVRTLHSFRGLLTAEPMLVDRPEYFKINWKDSVTTELRFSPDGSPSANFSVLTLKRVGAGK